MHSHGSSLRGSGTWDMRSMRLSPTGRWSISCKWPMRRRGGRMKSMRRCLRFAAGCSSMAADSSRRRSTFAKPASSIRPRSLRGPRAHPARQRRISVRDAGRSVSAAGIRSRGNWSAVRGQSLRTHRRRRRHARLSSHERVLAAAIQAVAGLQSARVVGGGAAIVAASAGGVARCCGCRFGINRGPGNFARRRRCGCCGRRGWRSSVVAVDSCQY